MSTSLGQPFSSALHWNCKGKFGGRVSTYLRQPFGSALHWNCKGKFGGRVSTSLRQPFTETVRENLVERCQLHWDWERKQATLCCCNFNKVTRSSLGRSVQLVEVCHIIDVAFAPLSNWLACRAQRDLFTGSSGESLFWKGGMTGWQHWWTDDF